MDLRTLLISTILLHPYVGVVSEYDCVRYTSSVAYAKLNQPLCLSCTPVDRYDIPLPVYWRHILPSNSIQYINTIDDISYYIISNQNLFIRMVTVENSGLYQCATDNMFTNINASYQVVPTVYHDNYNPVSSMSCNSTTTTYVHKRMWSIESKNETIFDTNRISSLYSGLISASYSGLTLDFHPEYRVSNRFVCDIYTTGDVVFERHTHIVHRVSMCDMYPDGEYCNGNGKCISDRNCKSYCICKKSYTGLTCDVSITIGDSAMYGISVSVCTVILVGISGIFRLYINKFNVVTYISMGCILINTCVVYVLCMLNT